MFTTACKVIPPMGFSNSITVLQNDSVFRNSNTCPLELELPGLVKMYEKLKKIWMLPLMLKKDLVLFKDV